MVRPMISKVCAASFVVIFGVASFLVPSDTFARSGGFGGRSSFSISPGFHFSVLRPSLHGFPPAAHLPAHQRQSQLRDFGFGLPLIVPGGAFGYSPYYAPLDYGGPYQPSYVEPEIVTGAIPRFSYPILPIRRGCGTQAVTVPAENGEERSINIVRC